VAGEMIESLGGMLGMLTTPEVENLLFVGSVICHRPLKKGTVGMLHPRSQPSLHVAIVQDEIGLRKRVMESGEEAVALYETGFRCGDQIAERSPGRQVLAQCLAVCKARFNAVGDVFLP